MSSLLVAFIVLFITVLFVVLRLYLILPRHASCPLPRRRGTPTRLLIVLGSGGHTAEMLSMLQDLDPRNYTHRSYVVSSGDAFSARRAVEFEERLERKAKAGAKVQNGEAAREEDGWGQDDEASATRNDGYGSYDIAFVPRARKIHQSLFTTPLSCVTCMIVCLRVLRKPSVLISSPSSTLAATSPNSKLTYPHVMLLNGPATSLVVVLSAVLLRFLGLPGTKGMMRSVFVESWARVKKMSLTGRILHAAGLSERILVQWEALKGEGREFRGAFVR